MLIPKDAIIADEKLTRYLLVPRLWDDKSGFLAQAGFMLDTWTDLLQAIRRLADSVEAEDAGGNEYGRFYRVEGPLVGPGGALRVKLIWVQRAVDGKYYFVTLVPSKE